MRKMVNQLLQASQHFLGDELFKQIKGKASKMPSPRRLNFDEFMQEIKDILKKKREKRQHQD